MLVCRPRKPALTVFHVGSGCPLSAALQGTRCVPTPQGQTYSPLGPAHPLLLEPLLSHNTIHHLWSCPSQRSGQNPQLLPQPHLLFPISSHSWGEAREALARDRNARG